MSIVPGDPAIGPELSQRIGIVPRGVGRQADGLPHAAEAATASAGCQRVLEGELRIDLEESPRHDKVLGHPRAVALVQGAQLAVGSAVQLLASDILVDLRRLRAVCTIGATQITGIVVRNPVLTLTRGPTVSPERSTTVTSGTGATLIISGASAVVPTVPPLTTRPIAAVGLVVTAIATLTSRPITPLVPLVPAGTTVIAPRTLGTRA
jgi:hypothetical protein